MTNILQSKLSDNYFTTEIKNFLMMLSKWHIVSCQCNNLIWILNLDWFLEAWIPVFMHKIWGILKLLSIFVYTFHTMLNVRDLRVFGVRLNTTDVMSFLGYLSSLLKKINTAKVPERQVGHSEYNCF